MSNLPCAKQSCFKYTQDNFVRVSNTRSTILPCRTQQMTSVYALAEEVFQIIGKGKNQVRIDQWLGYELTQTWVRNDRVRKDWIPHPYHRSILIISSFLLNKNLSMVKLVNMIQWCPKRFFILGGLQYARIDDRKIAKNYFSRDTECLNHNILMINCKHYSFLKADTLMTPENVTVPLILSLLRHICK